MEYRRLGASDLVVSEICLGSWLTVGVGITQREAATAIVDRAFDLGDQLRRHRERVRPRCRRGAPRRDPRGSPARLLRARDEALLPDGRRRTAGSRAHRSAKQIEALAATAPGRSRRPLPVPPLRRGHAARGDDGRAHRGRSRRARRATSGSASGRRRRSRRRWRSPGVERFVSSQPQYSLLHRVPEREVIPLCAANGIGQIVFSPLAQGVLTGQVPPRASRCPTTRAPRRRRWAGRWGAS